MKKISQLYRKKVALRDGVAIWIVDGACVRREFFIDFVLGGHAGRYLFIPKDEIWIDASTSVEELDYVIRHELRERELMMNEGYTYNDAHDAACEDELKSRKKDINEAEEKNASLGNPRHGAWWIYEKEEQENP